MEGKKRKILGLHTNKKSMKKPLDKKTQEALDNIEINTQSLLEEELAKLPKLNKNEALVQIHTGKKKDCNVYIFDVCNSIQFTFALLAYPWSTKDDVKLVDWKYPLTADQQLKYKVFKDLWERKYYVTSGEKFGGDFLAYPGIILSITSNELAPYAHLLINFYLQVIQ